MAKPANKSRGEVALTKAGTGVVLRFTVDSLERLEAKFGADYFDAVIRSMTKLSMVTYKTCIEVALELPGGDDTNRAAAIAGMPWGMPFADLQELILDALFLTVHGKSFEEYKEVEKAMLKKQLEEAAENPQLAALLSFRPSAPPVTEQGSDLEQSDT